MFALFAAIRWFKHSLLIGGVLAGWLAGGAHPGASPFLEDIGPASRGAHQEKVQPPSPTKCKPELASKPTPKWPRSLRVRKGESYKGAPVISFNIPESGYVTDIQLVRSSGVRDVDAWVLSEVRNWKYKLAAGCGIRHSQVSVTIDFDLSPQRAEKKAPPEK